MEELGFTSNHPNMQRGNHSGLNFDRSASFREGSEGTMFSSNAGPSRGSSTLLGHLPPISQFLALEPLPMMDKKCMQSGDLRKVLGISAGATAEVPVEELNRFKSSVLDTSLKARGRLKKLDEGLHKVNKYCDALHSIRQQRNESFMNERPGGSNLLKIGSQIPRNSSEFVNQRIEDRTKSISLNKRIRSSAAENRGEGQASTVTRQPLFMGKDRDVGEGSDLVEEKIQKLPGGGESWEKKMKKKRSTGNVFSRATDSYGEIKKVTQKIRDFSSAMENPAPDMKGKASRASRSSLTMAAASPSNLQPPPGTLESGSNNRKRPIPPGPSPITQWGSQRSQKMFRTRRANLVSPLSNHEEIPTSVGNCTSDLVPSGSMSLASGIQQLKVKLESISSPARFSESEESVAGESHESWEVGIGNNMGALVKKNKINKGDNGRDSFTGPALVVKLEYANSKPLRSPRPTAPKKNESNSRRPPLKKQSNRKGFSRRSKTPTSSDPDFAAVGESDDDREELLAAACSASSASCNASTGVIWKKLESLFSAIRTNDISYLEQQVKSSDESHKNLLKNLGSSNNDQEDNHGGPQGLHASKELSRTRSSIDGKLDTEEGMKVPLYRRVLAALITDEDQDEAEGRNLHLQHGDAPRNGKSKDNGSSLGYNQFMANLQLQSEPDFERFPCNGMVTKNPRSRMNYDFYQNGIQGRLAALSNSVNSSCDEQYLHLPDENKLLMELNSIGLYPDNVPGLADGEESIDDEISKLQKRHMEKVGKKKALLSKLAKAVKEDEQMNQRDLEQVAMDKLVETAYRKQLATQASYASKHGIRRVPKQVATACTERTLARCRNFEETGKSCFSKSPFAKVLSAQPPRREDHASPDMVLASASSSKGPKRGNFVNPSEAFASPGLVLNQGKKKELSLDDVGGGVSVRITANLGNTLTSGAKGKRSPKKTKTKPRHRVPQSISAQSGGTDVKREKSNAIVGKITEEALKEKKDSGELLNLDVPLESIGDLDVQSLLNFDGDGLQDHYSMGLEIPMDDLSDIFA